MLVHDCSPGTQETEWIFEFDTNPGHVGRPCLQKQEKEINICVCFSVHVC